MAYSFQTFSVLEVLGAAKMNQVEVNVRDHVHGASSVSGDVPNTAATQANQETATSLVTIVTPGRQHFHPSAAKAAILAPSGFASVPYSYNVTSLTDSGVGRAVVNLTTAFSSANYLVVMGLAGQTGVENTGYKWWYDRDVVDYNSISISVQDIEGNTNVDAEIGLVAFGDQ